MTRNRVLKCSFSCYNHLIEGIRVSEGILTLGWPMKTEIDLIIMIYKGYQGSHFDYLGHSSVSAYGYEITVDETFYKSI